MEFLLQSSATQNEYITYMYIHAVYFTFNITVLYISILQKPIEIICFPLFMSVGRFQIFSIL